MKKSVLSYLLLGFIYITTAGQVLAAEEQISEVDQNIYLEAVINAEEAVEQNKSVIFDASQSFIPEKNKEISYLWDFGDGNKNEGQEVLHSYKEPGNYTVKLQISDGTNNSTTTAEVFVYRKLIVFITDQSDARERIETFQGYAQKQGVYLKLVESYGSSTEFISEEILNKKLAEQGNIIQKAHHIMIWTKGSAGLNALSRYIQNNKININQKTIIILDNSPTGNLSRIQKQYSLLKPKNIIVGKEASMWPVINSPSDEFVTELEKGGYEYTVINSSSSKIMPWNFMSYFVNFLINEGIPDNTIALLLLLPVIATVVASMKQVIGITTFGIYTPSIITLSFLIIGLYAGLLTLLTVIMIAAAVRPILRKLRILYIPKMAIIITLVSLVLLVVLIVSSYLELFDAPFLSIAIFPMLILSTLVEKFVSVKTEKGFVSAVVLMSSTVLVAIVAYIIAGGEVDFGLFTFQFTAIKKLMINHPELIILFIFINFGLGKWTGLRVLERVRFREVLRHIEE